MSSSDRHSLEPFVARLTMRSVLSAEERRAILALPTHPIVVRAKQDFVRINEETTYSCFIASGLVGRFGQTAAGARQFTALHIPGEMADLHSAVRPIGIGGLNALCNSTILRVPHSAIRSVAARYPAVAEAFWRDSMLDAAILMQWVMNVGRHDAKTRLAHIFCEMAVRYGRDQQGCCQYAFPITQEQLADAAGITGVHVNRSLKALRQEKLATLVRGEVRILNWAALAKLGEFNPAYLMADTKPERQRRMLAAE